MSRAQRVPFEVRDGEAEAPASARRGAALLAFLRAVHGPVPLALADDEARPQTPAPSHTGLPEAITEALLVRGGVVELVTQPGAGAQSLAFRLLAEAWARDRRRWLTAIATHEAGSGWMASSVAALGVPLDRLFVVTPPPDAFFRIAARSIASGAFTGVLLDATARKSMIRTSVAVRRLALAAEGAGATVFLVTRSDAPRDLPLPVAARAEISVAPGGGTDVVVRRHRHGLFPQVVIPPMSTLPVETFSMFTSTPRSPAGKAPRAPTMTLPRGEVHRRRRAWEAEMRAGQR